MDLIQNMSVKKIVEDLITENQKPLDVNQNMELPTLEEIYNLLISGDPDFKAVVYGGIRPEWANNLPHQAESTPPLANEMPQDTENVLEVVGRVPQGTENVPQVAERGPQVTERGPQGTERVPHVAEAVPHGFRNMPPIANCVPKVAEGVPQGSFSVPRMFQEVAPMAEGEPQARYSVPQVTEGVPQWTDGVPQVTQEEPHVNQFALRPVEGLHLNQPYLEIIEQPAAVRFRYASECKQRSAGSIPGANSALAKSFTTVKLWNYTGRFIHIASLVTKDKPYMAHPHKLVGNDCSDGVCCIDQTTEGTYEHEFKSLGIKFVKQNDIVESLELRKLRRVDPFNNRFHHKKSPKSIDLNAVRLCFQVFLESPLGHYRSLKPVVSNIIHNKKTTDALNISRTSHCSGSVLGGTQIIILCGKVCKDDIEVVFKQTVNDSVIWEALAVKILVHNNTAIVFQTPPYLYTNTTEHVNVVFQLLRTSDKTRSNTMDFEYIPEFQDVGIKKRKLLSSFLQNNATSAPGFDDFAVPGPSHISIRRVEKKMNALLLDEDSMSSNS